MSGIVQPESSKREESAHFLTHTAVILFQLLIHTMDKTSQEDTLSKNSNQTVQDSSTRSTEESVKKETQMERHEEPASASSLSHDDQSVEGMEVVDIESDSQTGLDSKEETSDEAVKKADVEEEYSPEAAIRFIKNGRQEALEKLLDLHFEVCFLEQLIEVKDPGTTIMDFPVWKRKPLTEHVRMFIHEHAGQELIDYLTAKYPLPPPTDPGLPALVLQDHHNVPHSLSSTLSITTGPPSLSAPSGHVSHPSRVLSQHMLNSDHQGISSPSAMASPTVTSAKVSTTAKARTTASKTNATPSLPSLFSSPAGSAVVYGSRAHATRQQSISAVYDSSIGSQEQIVERAKQEASVMQRIAELRKEGMWSLKKLPRVQEPQREKGHWDYLLEEMSWLATDFAQERKWKKNTAKKCAQMIMKYHRDKEAQKEKEKREEQQRIRKVASFIAKEIRGFWSSVEKLVEYKQQTALEKKRKHALDQHLNFIIGQTEQYTQLVTEGIQGKQSNAPSVNTDTMSVGTSTGLGSEDDFDPAKVSDDDDEETIDREEKDDPDKMDPSDEIAMLNRESDLPLQEVLPKEFLDVIPVSSLPSASTSTNSSRRKRKREEEPEADEEFKLKGDEEEDDEETIAEQEAKESAGYAEELKDLEDEANMTREQLLAKYAAAFEADYPEDEDSEDTAEEMSQEESQDETEEEEDLAKDDDEDQEEIGLESLIKFDDVSAPEQPVSTILLTLETPSEHHLVNLHEPRGLEKFGSQTNVFSKTLEVFQLKWIFEHLTVDTG